MKKRIIFASLMLLSFSAQTGMCAANQGPVLERIPNPNPNPGSPVMVARAIAPNPYDMRRLEEEDGPVPMDLDDGVPYLGNVNM